jgi:hypothetical protein
VGLDLNERDVRAYPLLTYSMLDYSGLSKEDLLRELQRLNQAVEYLRAENAALTRVRLPSPGLSSRSGHPCCVD